MMNEIYSRLIETLYNHLPTSIQNVIDNYGPEKLYSMVNPHLPYLDSILHGASYVPYAVATQLTTYAALGIKDKDIDRWEIKRLKQIGYGYMALIGPLIEEALFRFIPSQIGKVLGGDIGEMALLGLSTVLFAAAHTPRYKNKKFRGFISELFPSFFYMHTYLTGGFLSSFGLHSATNSIAYVALKASKDQEPRRPTITIRFKSFFDNHTEYGFGNRKITKSKEKPN